MPSRATPHDDIGVSERGVPFTRRVRCLGPAGPLRHAVESLTVYANGSTVRRREELTASDAAQRYGINIEDSNN